MADVGSSAQLHREQVRRRASSWGWMLVASLAANGVLFWLGMSEEAVTIGKTVVKTILGVGIRLVDERQTLSIISAIFRLREEGNSLLFWVLFLFSIVFPLCKWLGNAIIAVRIALDPQRHRQWMIRAANALHAIGKWSMLDVFATAILCVMMKLGDVTRLRIEAGLYFFMAAVFLSLVNAQVTSALLRSSLRDASP